MSRTLDQPGAPGQNTGHGHVYPRPDGARARCGGPGLCRQCAADAARKNAPVDWPTRCKRAAEVARPEFPGTAQYLESLAEQLRSIGMVSPDVAAAIGRALLEEDDQTRRDQP